MIQRDQSVENVVCPAVQQIAREVCAAIMSCEHDHDFHHQAVSYASQRLARFGEMTPAEDAIFQILSTLAVAWPPAVQPAQIPTQPLPLQPVTAPPFPPTQLVPEGARQSYVPVNLPPERV